MKALKEAEHYSFGGGSERASTITYFLDFPDTVRKRNNLTTIVTVLDELPSMITIEIRIIEI